MAPHSCCGHPHPISPQEVFWDGLELHLEEETGHALTTAGVDGILDADGWVSSTYEREREGERERRVREREREEGGREKRKKEKERKRKEKKERRSQKHKQLIQYVESSDRLGKILEGESDNLE